MFDGIAERGVLAPLFIVATARPEFRPPWSMRSHLGTISLAPLDRSQVRDMVAELSARHALPRDVMEEVAARTGGVPLFVEEVTRLLLERGEQGAPNGSEITQQFRIKSNDPLIQPRPAIIASEGRGQGFEALQARQVCQAFSAPARPWRFCG
jgi:hypothetical protein